MPAPLTSPSPPNGVTSAPTSCGPVHVRPAHGVGREPVSGFDRRRNHRSRSPAAALPRTARSPSGRRRHRHRRRQRDRDHRTVSRRRTLAVVDVTVTSYIPGGTSTTSAADQFMYSVTPAITNLSQTAGPLAGGIVVTITGTGFTGATAVDFGSRAATAFTVLSDTEITATAPGAAGDGNGQRLRDGTRWHIGGRWTRRSHSPTCRSPPSSASARRGGPPQAERRSRSWARGSAARRPSTSARRRRRPLSSMSDSEIHRDRPARPRRHGRHHSRHA